MIFDNDLYNSVFRYQPLQEIRLNQIIEDDFTFLLGDKCTMAESDFERLRAYSDKERKLGARVLLGFVVAHPDHKNLYADFVNDTLSVFSSGANNTKPLVQYLSDVCKDEFNKIFSQEMPSRSSQWGRSIKIGAFLCELYDRLSIRICAFNYWLDKLHQMVPIDIEATKMFLSLKVTFVRMKEFEPKRYATYLKLLQKLMDLKIYATNELSQNSSESPLEAVNISWRSLAAQSNTGAFKKT